MMHESLSQVAPRKIGYARVSSGSQSLLAQTEQLRTAGCDLVVEEKESGTRRNHRPVLTNLLEERLLPGDTLVVTRLDRVSGSLRDLLDLLDTCKQKKVAFQSLLENLKTNTEVGELVMNVLESIAQFQRGVMKENQREGIDAALARGVRFGPKPKLSEEQVAFVKRMVVEEGKPVAEVAKILGVSRFTLYKILGKKGWKLS